MMLARLGLHEPPLFLAAGWQTHVLPRLYAFAEAVHRLRASTALRYHYLLAAEHERNRWIQNELPHLSMQ